MPAQEARWKPRQMDIAAKVLDGEAVIIDLARGTYYSMDGVGAVVWELLEAGRTLAELTTAVTRSYGVSAERARQDLRSLVEDLLAEDLIVEVDAEKPRSAGERDEPGAGGEYEPPKLHVYRDMADLMVFLEPPTPGRTQEMLHFPGGPPGGCARGGNVPDVEVID
jgi:hypothetical protein